ncbi:hypothetical protein Leryth_004430 [Lithospermum erythrorhizon]|nr:hypothetical protein Leryth_004430 [Lithospermum erythrorhizon]
MASSDNLMAMDNSWMFRNAYPDTWLPETFLRETETFTKTVQKSFDPQVFDNMNFSNEFMSPWLNNNSDTAPVSIHTPTASCGSAENEINNNGCMKRSNGVVSGGVGGGGGKMKKRKTRASKRSTTTFINADAANFRQLVQDITGVKFGGGRRLFSVGGGGDGQVVKPQPHRGVHRLQMINNGGGGGLVTLDTSAFLVDPTHQNTQDKVVFDQQMSGGGAPSSVVVEGGGAVGSSGFEFDSFCSFPTLESWKAI